MGQACCGSCGSPFIPNLRLNPPAVPPGWGGAKGGGGGDGKGKGKGKGWGQAQGTGFGVVGTKGWAAGKGQQVSPQAYLGVPPGNFGNFGGKGGGGFGQGVGPVQASLAQGFFGSSKRRRNAAVRVAREDAAAAELAAYSDAESMADIPVGVDSAKCFLASKHHGRVARDLKATNPDASRQCEATQRMLSQCGQARLPPAQRVATLQRQYQARLDELDRLVAQQEDITARLSAAQDEAAELSTQLESARTAVLATTPASAAGGDGAAILHQAHQFLASLPPTDGASMQAMQALFQVFQQHFRDRHWRDLPHVGQRRRGPSPLLLLPSLLLPLPLRLRRMGRSISQRSGFRFRNPQGWGVGLPRHHWAPLLGGLPLQFLLPIRGEGRRGPALLRRGHLPRRRLLPGAVDLGLPLAPWKMSVRLSPRAGVF